MRRIARILLAIVTVLPALAIGCNASHSAVKELNEATAATLLQAYLDQKQYKISVQNVANLFKQTLTNYRNVDPQLEVESIIKTLIERGFVRQTTQAITYPRISGTFANDHTPTGRREYRLELVQGTNQLTGRYLQDTSYDIQVKGTVEPDGKVVLQLVGWSSEQAVYREESDTAYLEFVGSTWGKYFGKPTGKTVTLDWYTYSWSPDFEKLIVNDGKNTYVVGGRFTVGTVSDLRLSTETQATGTFQWKPILNDTGKLIFPRYTPDGNGQVTFGKKPDGSWFVDHEEMKYSNTPGSWK